MPSRARRTREANVEVELAMMFARDAAIATAGVYPLIEYEQDPVRYVRERLLEPYMLPHQAEMLGGLADGIWRIEREGRVQPDRVACRSGQKSGKTKTVVWAALWFYECFDAANVYMCAAIVQQTKNVLWRELGLTLEAAKKRGVVIDGKLAASPSGGLLSSDGTRRIKGVSGREIEALAGLSGRMLTIIDEASHLPEAKAQAFVGNTLGGGALFMISNPTRNEGPFFEAFHGQKEFWQTFHVDSERVAQWQAETGIRIPFTASLEKIEEARAMYGEDSPFWFLRVKGEWLRNETGRAIPYYRIVEAIARWDEASDTDGPLWVGWDPAGPGDGGDEHAWAVVRGNKCIALFAKRCATEDAALEETYSILRMYRREDETPSIAVDVDGVGWELYGRMRGEAEHRRTHQTGDGFEVFAVKASSKFVRDKTKFDRVRHELVWVLAEWMQAGAIPNDPKLPAELYAHVWSSLPSGQIQITAKSKIRDFLRRSPDRMDALALAVYRPQRWAPTDAPAAAVAPRIADSRVASIDAYDWERSFRH